MGSPVRREASVNDYCLGQLRALNSHEPVFFQDSCREGDETHRKLRHQAGKEGVILSLTVLVSCLNNDRFAPRVPGSGRFFTKNCGNRAAIRPCSCARPTPEFTLIPRWLSLPEESYTSIKKKCFLLLTGEVWSRILRLAVLHAAHQKRDCEL